MPTNKEQTSSNLDPKLMTEKKQPSDIATQSDVSISQEMMTLEPRYLFDAAGVATAGEAAADQVAQDQADNAGKENAATADVPATNGLDRALRETAAPTGTNSDRQDIVFVDTSVENYEQLLAGISPSADVVLINGASDGLSQIADALEGRENVDGLHIISHGGAGRLNLGGESIDFNNLSADQRSSLDTIGSALSESADILIYGCDFGAGDEGQSAIESFADLTGADIAASDDLTGTRELGGDYELEINLGAIESAQLLTAETAGDWRGTLNDTVADITGANFGTSGAGNPLTLWIDTSDTSTILDSGGGSISDGEAVGTVQDKSGQGNNLTADAGEEPTYTADDGGNPALTFDGVNDLLKGDFDYDYNDHTLFVVLASNDTATNNVWIAGKTDNGDDRVGVYLNDFALQPSGDGNMGYRGAVSNNSGAAGTADNDDGGGVAAAAVDDGTTKTYGLRIQDNDNTTSDLNGSREEGTTENLAAGDISNLDNRLFTLGGVDAINGSFGNKFFSGTVREVILFNRALNDAEMEVMNNYLSQKWGTNLNAVQENYEPTGSNHNEDVNGITVQTANDSDDYNPGTKSSALSGGLTLSNSSSGGFLQDDLGDGGNDSFYIGHDTNTGTSTADLGSSGASSRAGQTWYFDINDVDNGGGGNTGGNVDLAFDLGANGLNIDGSVPGGSRFALLFRSGTSGDFSRVGSFEGTRSSDTVTFSGINTTALSGDGFYTLGILPANADPVIGNLNGDTVTFTEDTDTVVNIDQGGDATVTDADSADLDGGNLTVSFTAGNDNAEDVLLVQNIGTGAGQIGVSGSNITFAGTTIGTFTGGSAGNDLVVTFNANATPAAAQALIRAIQYQNTDTDNPTTGNRTVRLVITDGDGGTSANADVTVNVVPTNDAPVVDNLNGDTVTFTEDTDTVVNIDQGGNATVADVDSADFNTGTLNVSFTAGSDNAEDVLLVQNIGTGAGQIGVSGSNISFGGTTIGTFTGGSSGNDLVVTFNANATPAAAQALIRAIQYQNTDTNDPTAGNRTVRVVLTDGDGGTSNTSDVTVSVVATNDIPVINNLGGDSVTFTEDTDTVVNIDQGGNATVTDVDSADLNTGTLTVSFTAGSDNAEDVLLVQNIGTGAGQIGVSGSDITFAGTTIGSFTGGSAGNDLVITFNANATPAAAQALIRAVQYQNTDTDNPTAGNRTVRVVLTDGDGGTSANSDVTVNVVPVNDPPVVGDLNGNMVTFTEDTNTVVNIDAGNNATVTDVDSADFNTGTLNVSFTAGSDNAEDVLLVQNIGTGAGQIGVSGSNISFGGTTIGTFTGGSAGNDLVVTFNANATPAAAQALIRAIQYQNTDTDNPTTGNRTVRVVLTDGDGGTSNASDVTVSVVATNDVPVIDNLGGDSVTFTEDTDTVVNIDQGGNATVTDVDSADFNGGNLTVSFTAGSDNAEDVLLVQNIGTGAGQIGVSGSDISFGGTTIGTFTGGSAGNDLVITFNANATPAAAQALVRAIQYQNTDTDNPTAGNRTVRVVLTDGDGGTSANSDVTVNVVPVNDPPVVGDLNGNMVTFTEDTDTVVNIDAGNNATVTDVDSADFNTGTLNVSFTAGSDNAEDVLLVQNIGTGAGQIGVSGSDISFGGTTIGTFTGGSAGNDLVVTFNANSTPAAAQALIRAIQYQNTDTDNPTTGDRTIRVLLTDGDGGTSNASDVTVSVVATNDAPVVGNLNGDAVTFTEDVNTVVNIDQGGNATVTDVDSADLNTGTLTVSFTAGSDNAEDVLLVQNIGTGAGQIGVSGSNITFAGTTIGTFTGGSTGNDLVITFNANATPAAAQALIRAVQYQNTDTDNPTTGNRTVRVVLTDGDGGTSNTSDVTVTVVATNDAPVLDLDANNSSGAAGNDFSVAYTEGTPVSIADTDISITDVDDTNIESATITLTNRQTGDLLQVNGSLPSGITASAYNAATGVLTLSGSASLADYQTAIQAIQFNTGDNPATLPNRSIEVIVNDGDTNSVTATTTVTVTAINDAPTVSTSASYNFGSGPNLTLSGSLSVADVDADNDSLTLTLSVGQGTLTIVSGTTGAVVSDSGTASVTVRGSLTQLNNLLSGNSGGSVTYVNGSPSGASTTFTLTANDEGNNGDDPGNTGDANSEEGTTTVNINFNQPPVVDLNGGGGGNDNTVTFTENDANTPVSVVPAATVTDSEGDDIQTITFALSNFLDKTAGTEVLNIGGTNFTIDSDNQTSAITGGHTGTYDATNNTLTITLAGSTDTAAAQTLLRTLTYVNNGDNPDPASARTIGITLTDSSGSTSANHNANINVVATNDAPVITNLPTDVTVVEETASNLDLSAVSLSDVDARDRDIRVILEASEGVLSTPGGNSGGVTAEFNANKDTLTLTGTVANIDAYLNTASNIQYTSAADDTGDNAATITFTINDDGNTGDGGPLFVRETINIDVTNVNDPPTLTDLDNIEFSEEDVNSAPQIVDTAITFNDIDSPDLDGGRITFSFTANGGAEDHLSIRNEGTGAGQIGFDGTNITFGGTTIGTLLGGNNGNNGGDLIFDFNANATPAAVDALIQNLTYQNSSDNPTAIRTLGITVTDGDGGSTGIQALNITVTNSNDAPVLTNLDDIAFDENTVNNTPQIVDAAISLTDIDSADFDGGQATFTFTSNGSAADQLSIRNEGTGAGQIGFDGTNITFGGTAIGTINGANNGSNGTDLVIDFNANSSPAAVDALIQNLTFQNTSDNPIATRTLGITVTDGDGGSTNQQALNITINPENDAPTLTDLTDVTFNEADVNAGPELVDTAVTFNDIDSPDLDGGVLTFSFTANGTTADQLSLRNQGTGTGQIGFDGTNITFGGTTIGTINGANNGANGNDLTINLNGNATPVAVDALIQNLTYQNTADNPAASRTLGITVTDGDGGTTGVQTLSINVNQSNDAPTINLDPNNSGGGLNDGGFSVGYEQGRGPVNVTDTDISITDPDNTEITSIRITASGFANGAQEQLIIGGTTFALNANASQTVSFGGQDYQVDVTNNGGTITITRQGGGQLPINDFQSLVADIKFNHTATPAEGTRTLDFVVNDGVADSQAVRSTISVPPNEAPIVNLDPNNTSQGADDGNFQVNYTQGNAAVNLTTADATLTDNENDNITQLTFTLGGAQDGANEVLSIGGTTLAFVSGTNGSTVTFNGTTYDVAASTNGLTLSLTPQGGGNISISDAQSLIRAASYQNTSLAGNITAGDRTIGISANDSLNTSNQAVSTITVIQDGTPPRIPTVNSQATSDNTPTITGTYDSADAAGGFQVTVNGVTYVLGTDPELTTNGDNWTLDLNNLGTPLADDTYEVVARATDGAGNSSTDASAGELIIDTVAPTAPTVTPQVTNDTTPTITGTATVATGETLTVTVNGVTYTSGDGNLSVDNNTWSLTIPNGNELPENTFDVTATVTDQAGNATSDPSTAELTVDLTPPVGPGPTVVSQVTNDNTPTITGTATVGTNETFTVEVNGVTYTVNDGNLTLDTNNNTWSLTIPNGNALPDDTYNVTATITDQAGNTTSDPSSAELIVDTAAPTAPTVTPQTTNDTTPTITGTATVGTGETLTVTVNGVTYTAGDGNLTVDTNNNTWSLTIPNGNELPESTFDVTATVTDQAGNATSDPSVSELVIDLTPPTVNEETTSDPTPNLTGTGAPNEQLTITVDTDGDGNPDVTYQVTTDAQGNWLIDPDNAVPLSGAFPQNLGDGDSIQVTATDPAGNTDTGTINIAQRVPALDLVTSSDSAGDSNTDDITNDNTPTIVHNSNSPGNLGNEGDTVTLFDSDGTTVIGTGTVQNDGSWSITPTTPLADGVHNFTARYTDANGNQGPASAVLSVLIDTVAPVGYDIDQSADEIADNGIIEAGEEVSVTITGSGALPSRPVQVTFSDSIGGQIGPLSITADANGNWAVTNANLSTLADGPITVSAFVIDAAGNVGPTITRSITKDTFTPEPAPEPVVEPEIDTGDPGIDTDGGDGVLSDTISGDANTDVGLDTGSGDGVVGDVVNGSGGNDVGINTGSGDGVVADVVEQSLAGTGNNPVDNLIGGELLDAGTDTTDPNALPATEAGPDDNPQNADSGQNGTPGNANNDGVPGSDPTQNETVNRGSLRVALADTNNNSDGNSGLARTELVIETSVQDRIIDVQLDLRRSGISVDSGVQYDIRSADGSPLPDELIVDLEEGTVKGLVPVNVERLDLVVEITMPNGQVITRNISIDVETAQSESVDSDTETSPPAEDGVALLSEQLEQVAGQFERQIETLDRTLRGLS